MPKPHLTIATRESPLAIWQANWVKERLEALHLGLTVVLLGMTTQADRMLLTPLNKIGGKGLFVKELEEALLDGRADLAVHSMKDMPMELPPGLCLPVMCEREDPRDAFVSNQFVTLTELPPSSVVGTSSLRRQSQLQALRPDLHMNYLRGNVNTRLKKLDDNDFAAIILAAAGLKRLGFEKRIRSYLTIEESLPAAGQGVLGIECRESDLATQELILPLRHLQSQLCVTAERALCRRLGGGCQVPIAAYAELQNEKIFLRGLVANANGSQILRVEFSDGTDHADQLGLKAAEELLHLGAGEILRELHI